MRCSMLRSVDAIRRVRAYRRVSRRKSSSRGGATTHTSTPASASARCTAVEYTPVLSIRSFVRKTQLLLAELHDVQRFPMARALMAYLGLVPGEHSSGDRHRRGPITKTGNSLARRRVVATPWPPRRRGGSVWPVRTLPNPPSGSPARRAPGRSACGATRPAPQDWSPRTPFSASRSDGRRRAAARRCSIQASEL